MARNPHAKWVKKPAQFIEGVKRTYYNREARKAVKEAAKPFLPAMRAFVPKDSKRLMKNLGNVVRTYRSNAKTISITGARRKRPVTLPGVISRGKNKGKPRIDLPSRRAHFSERENQFITRAYDSHKDLYYSTVKRLLAESLKKYYIKV